MTVVFSAILKQPQFHKWSFSLRKQSFKKFTVILRVTGKLLLKSKNMCLNEIFELTILMLKICKNVFLKDI